MHKTTELLTNMTSVGVVGANECMYQPHKSTLDVAFMLDIPCHSLVISDTDVWPDIKFPFSSVEQSVTDKKLLDEQTADYPYRIFKAEHFRSNFITDQHVERTASWIIDRGVNLLLSRDYASEVALKAAFRAARIKKRKIRLLSLHPEGTFPGSWESEDSKPSTYSQTIINKSMMPAGLTVRSHVLVSDESRSTV